MGDDDKIWDIWILICNMVTGHYYASKIVDILHAVIIFLAITIKFRHLVKARYLLSQASIHLKFNFETD